MEIIVLGTGHGMAINCYNTCFALEENEKYFLVDTGGGNTILKHLALTNIDINNIEAMFVSHTHTDHIMGTVWILRAVARKCILEESNKKFNVYGNSDVIKSIKQIAYAVLPTKFIETFDKKIFFNIVDTGSTAKIIGHTFNFFDINAKKVKQTGFYTIYKNNKKFVFIGDETCNSSTEKYVENSEWLFADAYMAGEEAEIYNPIKRHCHSTVKFVATLCDRLNVKNVILSHTIDNDLKNRKKIFTQDAKKYFNGNVFVPDDLERIKIL